MSMEFRVNGGGDAAAAAAAASQLEDNKKERVIRGLRRRLWRAFQQDDAKAALRCYQATFDDYEQILREEEEGKGGGGGGESGDEMDNGHRSRSPRVTRRRSSIKKEDENRHRSRSNGKTKGGGRRRSSLTRENSRPSLVDKEALQQLGIAGTMATDIHRSTRSILQTRMKPSDPFRADDFLSPFASYEKAPQTKLPDVKKKEEEKLQRKRRKQQKPRSAFNIFSYRKDLNNNVPDAAATAENGNGTTTTATDENGNPIIAAAAAEEVEEEDPNMTTPLHEAARLGSGSLIRVLLSHGGDANVKNGKQRTALHMACGGVSKDEHRAIVSINLPKDKEVAKEAGILAPLIPKEVMDLLLAEAEPEKDKKKKSKKGVRKFKAVGKMLMRNSAHTSKSAAAAADGDKSSSASSSRPRRTRLDKHQLADLQVGRIDAAFTLLSWSHKSTGAGVSLNAVDDLGRSALHYAAEMGRSEICSAIMENFGTMYTIVDEIGSRTPCECAARQGHKELAAQLEARALLYVDPYGLDEELMASVASPYTDDEDGNALAPPFNWFKTLTPKDVRKEREKRMEGGLDRMREAIRQVESDPQRKAAKRQQSHGSSDDDEDLSPEELKIRREAASGNDELIAENNNNDDDDGGPDFYRLQDAHIERFFAFHRWDTYDAVDAFKKDPVKSFKKAQIQIPAARAAETKESEERTCPICFDTIEKSDQWMKFHGCGHAFCTECLEGYVIDCAKTLTPVSKIMCPQHGCKGAVGKDNVDKLVKNHPKTCVRIDDATVRHFVSSSYDFKFCNHPGCTGIVKKMPQRFFTTAGYDPDLHDYRGAVCTAGPKNRCPPGSTPTLTYDGVEDSKYNSCRTKTQPQRAHRFCFKCGEGMHWPCPCDKLKEWKTKMREEIGEVEEEETGGGGGANNADDLAMKMWVKANTKACPQCDVLIEKNDGCNHMTCVNPTCRYEFCWICLRDWKLHGSATGGFFRCNIWKEEGDGNPEVAAAAAAESVVANANANNNGEGGGEENDEGYGTAIYSARHQYRKRQEMNRFLHHYTRYEAHGQSARLERNIAEHATKRLSPVVSAAIEFDGSPAFNFGGKGLSFIHSAFTELLECRSSLKYSYAYSFFRYPTFFHFRRIDELNNIRREKIMFEKSQSELETITEQLSDVLARSHIRASQVQISFLTAGAAEKRVDFSNLMFSILHAERGKQRTRREGQPKKQFLSDYASDGYDSYDSYDEAAYGGQEVVEWSCTACTFINTSGTHCSMCGTPRM